MMNWENRLEELVSIELGIKELKAELEKTEFASEQEIKEFFTKLSCGNVMFRDSKKHQDLFTGLAKVAGCGIWIKAHKNGQMESIDFDLKEYYYDPNTENINYQILKIKDFDSLDSVSDVKNYITEKRNVTNIREIVCGWKGRGLYEDTEVIYEFQINEGKEYLYSACSMENVLITDRKLNNAELHKLANEADLYWHPGYLDV